MASMDRREAWIILNALPSLTPRRLARLLGAFGDPRGILTASEEELAEVIGTDAARKVARERKEADPQRELSMASRAGATVITVDDPAYPEVLLSLPSPPIVLYVLGELTPADRKALAIVGTRRATSYGRLVARKLGQELAARGITVVSGMAPGIDIAAHKGALEAGRTIAVLGTGLGRPYPAGSEKLLQEIAEHGAVVSEFPWEMEGTKWTFPRRNRIIAGLSQGVIVVEAPARSGALITAEYALEQGKEVFAVPGPITSTASQGTNRLIQEGAVLVASVEDILGEFPGWGQRDQGEGRRIPELSPQARGVYEALAAEPLGISELMERTGLPHGELSGILLELELAGLIQELPGRRFTRADLGT
ncbi:MAG TPA: DNA-protecting protein DprA [Candidatus Acetothermia bacterium]|nr:DNA-protecting protein DprA [Candidatus Acetothermia bacterium]